MRKSFTLVEIVLVLTLMALFSTLVLQSFLGSIEQTNADITLKNLESLQTAILGNPSDPLVGYIETMGAPPKRLEDLWINPDPQKRLFGRKQARDHSEVELYCGWRGPYLLLSPGQTTLKDGWGNAFELLDREGNPLTPDTPFDMIRSLGSDHEIGGESGYQKDLIVAFSATTFAVDQQILVQEQELYRASIDVVVKAQIDSKTFTTPDPEQGDIIIRYYSPDPQTGEIRYEDQTIFAPFQEGENFRRTIPASIGSRAILAFQAHSEVTLLSEIHYLQVVKGVQPQEVPLLLIQGSK